MSWTYSEYPELLCNSFRVNDQLRTSVYIQMMMQCAKLWAYNQAVSKWSTCNKLKSHCAIWLTTIMDIIFWDFLILYQIFFSSKLKRSVIIINKYGIAECLKTQDLRKLGKIRKISKLQKIITYVLPSLPLKLEIFWILTKKL